MIAVMNYRETHIYDILDTPLALKLRCFLLFFEFRARFLDIAKSRFVVGSSYMRP